jgi:hypothetical protein
MGLGQSTFRREELEVYEACTCLSGAEIIELFEKFTDLGGVREGDDETEATIRGAGAALRMSMDAEKGGEGGAARTGKKVKMEHVIKQSELRNNPFKKRLCEIFTSEPKGTANYGDLTFDEFVDLYNTMSARASKEVKTQTAFRLYDFDDNGYLTRPDLSMLLQTISTTPKNKNLLTEAEIKDIVERVMRDCARATADSTLSLYFPPPLHPAFVTRRCMLPRSASRPLRTRSLSLSLSLSLSSQATSTATIDSPTPSSLRW